VDVAVAVDERHALKIRAYIECERDTVYCKSWFTSMSAPTKANVRIAFSARNWLSGADSCYPLRNGPKMNKILLSALTQIAWIFVFFRFSADVPADRRLWVLREPDQIVEYNPRTFDAGRSLQVPPEAVQSPSGFSINRIGQMLFVPGLLGNEVEESRRPAADRIWRWDRETASWLNRGIDSRKTKASGKFLLVETIPQCFLSADGRHLFWFANESHKLREEEDGADLSVTNTFRAWRTDLNGSQKVQLAVFSFSPCRCETGVCSETCPEVDCWVPGIGISDFFIATHWIPGQSATSYQASFLYRESGGRWIAERLPQALESILDTAQNGEILLHAALDQGCCGWENEGNDQTWVIKDGKSIVLFDERKRFANPDYDLSFYTSKALLSPDRKLAAMTIVSSAGPAGEIRLSSDGKADSRELERIRQAAKALPAVEVLRLGDPPVRLSSISHATLAGWLNDQEVAIVQDQALVFVNLATGTRRQSRIQVPQASRIYLR
jgi:hypothetical protein